MMPFAGIAWYAITSPKDPCAATLCTSFVPGATFHALRLNCITWKSDGYRLPVESVGFVPSLAHMSVRRRPSLTTPITGKLCSG